MKTEIEYFYDFLDSLKAKKEVDAILLLGGLGEQKNIHNIDHYSDYDVALFLSGKQPPLWLPNFSFSLYMDHEEVGRTVNVYQMYTSVLFEPNCVWGVEKCEAYRYAFPYFLRDKNSGIMDRIFQLSHTFDDKSMCIGLLHKINRFINNKDKLLFRNSPLSLWIMYNNAYEMLIKCAFLIKGYIFPHIKWYENDMAQNRILPPNIMSLLYDYVNISSLDHSSFEKRYQILKDIYAYILMSAEQNGISPDYTHVNTTINRDRQLQTRTAADAYSVNPVLYSYINTKLLTPHEAQRGIQNNA